MPLVSSDPVSLSQRSWPDDHLRSLLAHEFRSPLAVIQGYAGLLATGGPGPVNTTQREFLSGIDDKVAELVQLVNDVLDWSRLDSGDTALQVEPCGLTDLLGRVTAERETLGRRRNVDVTTQVTPPELVVTADPRRLSQVLDCLILDMIGRVGEGDQVTVNASAKADNVILVIGANGPDRLDQNPADVFTAFQRGGNAAYTPLSGLSLTVARGLVKAHGGQLVAEREDGGVLRFHLSLPLNAQPGPDEV